MTGSEDFLILEADAKKTLSELDNKLLVLRVEQQRTEIDLKFTRKFLAMLKKIKGK